MIKFRSASTALALPLLLALVGSPALAQQDAQGNKAGKPPTDAAAAESGAATKKPAKPGAQSGPASPEADASKAAKGNKAGKPPADDAAAKSDVATKKPAKSGSQSGAAPAASAP